MLAITELHENILLFLDVRTLLLAQRVNTKWRDIITANKKLQKKLFFKAAEDFEEVLSLGTVGGDVPIALDISYRRQGGTEAAVFNPLITEHAVLENSSEYDGFYREISDRILPDTISVHRGKSSWERMYLSQPPDTMWCEVVITNLDDKVTQGKAEEGEFDRWWSSYCEDDVSTCAVPMREMMDGIEEGVMRLRGSMTKWKNADLRYDGAWITTYRELEQSGGLKTLLKGGVLTKAGNRPEAAANSETTQSEAQ